MTNVDDHRARHALRMRRYRAGTGRTPTARIPLVALGRMLRELARIDRRAHRAAVTALGVDVADRALLAAGRSDTPTTAGGST